MCWRMSTPFGTEIRRFWSNFIIICVSCVMVRFQCNKRFVNDIVWCDWLAPKSTYIMYFHYQNVLKCLICSLYIAWNCMSSCNGHIMINRFHKAINHPKLFARVCRYSRFKTISFISIYCCAHIWDITILFEIQQHSSDLMIRDWGRFGTIKLFL